MKKLTRKVLVLDRMTIRNLQALDGIVGGSLISTDFDACVTSGCTKADVPGCRPKKKML